jgi:transcriptional regulator with XRE-family HTH domain
LREVTNERSARFGERVRLLRGATGLSQADLAERLGLSQSAMSHYESGRNQINADDVPRFADALGVHPTVFYESLSDFQDHCTELYRAYLRGDPHNRAYSEAAAYVQAIMFGGISPFRQLADEPLEPAMTG